MVYVVETFNGRAMFRNEQPKEGRYFEMERKLPVPVKKGYTAVLFADFETPKAEYRLIDISLIGRARDAKIAEIETYDKSDAVNQFSIGGVQMWLTRDERASLKIRFEAEKTAGRTNTVLWFGGMSIPMEIDTGLALLVALELYAAECYDRTNQHIAAVRLLDDCEAIEQYDYTTGYPEKLEF